MTRADRRVDMQALKWPLLLLVLAICFSAGLVTASLWFKSQHAETRSDNYQRLQSLQTTERKTRESGRIYKNYYGRYQALNARGFIGEERRLLWIEALRTSSTENAPFGVEYAINEQRPYDGYLAVEQQRYHVQQSEMDLTLKLSHEGRLLKFLNSLESANNGVFDVQECTLSPEFAAEGLRSWQANITANCRLNWYTLKPVADEVEPL